MTNVTRFSKTTGATTVSGANYHRVRWSSAATGFFRKSVGRRVEGELSGVADGCRRQRSGNARGSHCTILTTARATLYVRVRRIPYAYRMNRFSNIPFGTNRGTENETVGLSCLGLQFEFVADPRNRRPSKAHRIIRVEVANLIL